MSRTQKINAFGMFCSALGLLIGALLIALHGYAEHRVFLVVLNATGFALNAVSFAVLK